MQILASVSSHCLLKIYRLIMVKKAGREVVFGKDAGKFREVANYPRESRMAKEYGPNF